MLMVAVVDGPFHGNVLVGLAIPHNPFGLESFGRLVEDPRIPRPVVEPRIPRRVVEPPAFQLMPGSDATPARELLAMQAIMDGLQGAVRAGEPIPAGLHHLALRVLMALRGSGLLVEPELATAPAVSADELDELLVFQSRVALLAERVAGLAKMPTPLPVMEVLRDLVALCPPAALEAS